MRTLIAIPSMATMPVETVASLTHLLRTENDDIQIVTGSLVYHARDALVRKANKDGYTHILFIDSDMTFPADAYKRLAEHDKDIVTALCYGRHHPCKPCSYKRVRRGYSWQEPINEPVTKSQIKQGFFKVEGCGMAFCLIRLEVFAKMAKRYREWFEPRWRLGEDLAFCVRARKLGYEIWCDSTIDIGHVGTHIFRADDYLTDSKK